MNKQQIEDLMQSRGFTLWATLGGVALQFLTDHSSSLPQGINCFINMETKAFEFKYTIGFSAMQLVTSKCSPFDNNEHFDKHLNDFVEQVNKIKED